MKVVRSEENELEFDNGLKVIGYGDNDCCAYNYIDFEQFSVGREFPTMTAGQIVDAVSLKEDGFSLKDIDEIPAWAQARSQQNGYYSNMTDLYVEHNGKDIKIARLSGEEGY